jgi:hypothetical protein
MPFVYILVCSEQQGTFNFSTVYYVICGSVWYTGDSHYTHFHSPCFCISTVLFHYYEEHQYPVHGHNRSCCREPLSYTCSFADSPHHFDSGYNKLRPFIVFHSENTQAFVCSYFTLLYMPSFAGMQSQ